MRASRVIRRSLLYPDTVVESEVFDEDADAVVIRVRPTRWAQQRCGRCGRRCPGYDRGRGRRRWRMLDFGTKRAYLESEHPRVRCPEHGVTVTAVPWARHGVGHTRDFDVQAAWLTRRMSKTAVCLLLRVAWRTRSPYEWLQHVRMAKQLGVTAEEIDTIAGRSSAAPWTQLEADLLAATDQLIDHYVIDDATWARLAERLDERQRMEVVFVVGSYTCLAMAFNSFGIELDPELRDIEAGAMREAKDR